jgi:N-acetylmuramoyl-L-alanine amidase
MYKFIILLLLSFNIYAQDRTTLYDFRFWTSPERTRIVVDTEAGIKYSITKKNHRITLKINHAKLLSRTYKHLFFKDKRIKNTKISRQGKTLSISFVTGQKYPFSSFQLKPSKRYPYHRLVIDLLDKSITKLQKTEHKKIILIDAGHGGEDSGALGYRHSKEKNITLIIAKKLAKIINKDKTMRAILTRKGDYYISLKKRVLLAQRFNADLFISIHADAVRRLGANGASVYTLSAKGEKSHLAKQLEKSENTLDVFGDINENTQEDKYLNRILWSFSRKDRDIQSQKLASQLLTQMKTIGKLHKSTPQKANFVVLKTPAIPSVLVETAFISNPYEEKRLNSRRMQNKISQAIYQGIKKYYQTSN